MAKFFALAITLLLCGCTVGPNYQRPTTELPQGWKISYEEAAGLADTAWWQEFNDPALDELIQVALKSNLDLMAATARVDQFLGQYRTTRSEAFPQIGASASVYRQQDTKTGLSPGRSPYNFYSGALNVNWELDLWGRIRRGSEAAEAELIASEAGRRTVLLTLVSNVASNYIVLLGLDRQLEIARKTEENYAESLRIFRARHVHGTASQVEVSQAESEYEGAVLLIPQLEAQIARQEHLLAFLLGQNPQPIIRGRNIDQLTLPGIPADLPSQLLNQRPDIIEAEQKLIAANARIGVARSLYYPNISLTGALGVATVNSEDLFSQDSLIWGIGGDLLAPVLTFGNIEGQVLSSEAAAREALYRYQQSILSSFREVEDALVTTTKERESLLAQGRRVDALSTYSRLATAQYDAGTTSYLQVLDANRSLFSSQLDYVESQTLVIVSLVDVYRAMGGGWLDLAEQETVEASSQVVDDKS